MTTSEGTALENIAREGRHRFGVNLKEGAERQIGILTSRLMADTRSRPDQAQEAFQTHQDELAKLVNVFCSCGDTACAVARNYHGAMVSGLRLGSIFTAAHSQVGARRETAAVGSLTETLISEGGNGMKLTRLTYKTPVLVDFNQDGTVAGTRPR